ncbi:SIP domain-containing protein [Rhizobium sp. No.120]
MLTANADRPVLSCAESLCRTQERAHLWAGCESSLARSLRLLCREHDLDRSRLHVSGYWKRGIVEYTDPTSDY